MKKKVENTILFHVKKGERVRVLTGDDKGKIGIVKEVLKKQNKVIVEGINLKIKHVRRRRYNEQGQVLEFEFPIHVSNVCKYEE